MLSTADELYERLQRICETNEYLEPIFQKQLGFGWREFVETIYSMAELSFYCPIYVRKDILVKHLEESKTYEKILLHLEYNKEKAIKRLSSAIGKAELTEGRLLFWHPIPTLGGNYFLSCQIILDSFDRYWYRYRKVSGHFVKSKGHQFEKDIEQMLNTFGVKVLQKNVVINDEIVPGESRAEYDLIAGKEPFLYVIEAKAYQPELVNLTEDKRRKLTADFVRKLSIKAQFISQHADRFRIDVKNYKFVVPILVSSYPLHYNKIISNVLVLTLNDLESLLGAKVDYAKIPKLMINQHT